MAKAEQDGVIEIDGVPRRIKAGQEIPEGATVRKTDTPSMARERQPVDTREPKDTGEPADAEKPDEKRALPKADADQRARGPAPENRGRE